MSLQAIADTLDSEGIVTVRNGALGRPPSVQAATGCRRPRPNQPPPFQSATTIPELSRPPPPVAIGTEVNMSSLVIELGPLGVLLLMIPEGAPASQRQARGR